MNGESIDVYHMHIGGDSGEAWPMNQQWSIFVN